MANMTPLQQLVLMVVASQSENYLISPEASAFKAEGLWDDNQINQALIELQDMGYAAFYTDDDETTFLMYKKDEEGNPILTEEGAMVPVLDEDGNVKTQIITTTVDSGWQITDDGRKALSDYGN